MFRNLKRMGRWAAIAVAIGLVFFSVAPAKKPDKPPPDEPDTGNPAWAVIEQNSDNVVLLDSDASGGQNLVGGGGWNYSPTFSPDGEWIAYIHRERVGRHKYAHGIYRIRVGGGKPEVVVPMSRGEDFTPSRGCFAWVPGETDRILYTGGYPSQIFVVSTVNAGTPVPLGLWGSAAMLCPDWEPDVPGYQGALAYSSGIVNVLLVEDGPNGLEVDLDSRQWLISLGNTQGAPAWSRDGTQLAFIHEVGLDRSLMTVPVLASPDGIVLFDELAQVVAVEQEDQMYESDRPTWSPDDQWLAFIAWIDGNYNLHVVPSDGSAAPMNLAPNHSYLEPDWNPTWVDDTDP
jgi:Tol biopolymer transport system component